MGKINKLHKDKYIRNKFFLKEKKILLYKYCILNVNDKLSKQYFWMKFLVKFHLNWSSARIVNKCLLTGRSRWILRKYKLSRISFRELADNCHIQGVRRASW